MYDAVFKNKQKNPIE